MSKSSAGRDMHRLSLRLLLRALLLSWASTLSRAPF